MPYGPSNGYGPQVRSNAARRAARSAPVIPTSNVRTKPLAFGGPSGPPHLPNQNGRPQTPMAPSPQPSPALGSGAPVQPAEGAGQGTTTNTSVQNPDQAAQDAFMQLLKGGPHSTAADEATIQQQMQANIGQNSADEMAGMAAHGFGMSGAAQAGLGDVRQRAARDAAQQTMGVREQARQDYLKNVQAGLQAQQADRSGDMTEQQWADYMSVLNAQTTQDNANQAADDAAAAGGRTSDGGTQSGSDTGGFNGLFGWNPTQNTGNDSHPVDPKAAAGATEAGGPPLLSYYEGSDAQFDYYTDESNGKVVKVKKK